MTQSIEISEPHFSAWGTWLPADRSRITRHLEQVRARVETDAAPLHPVMQEFADLLDDDPIVRMLVTEMIDQVPHDHAKHKLQDPDDMLRMINAVLPTAPEFNETDLVGCPINAIIDWTMCTTAGYAAFRNAKLNEMFRKILNVWSAYLSSPASRYVLNTSATGWKSEAALKHLHMEWYDYDPQDEYWGFASWNDFFTRNVTPTARPVDDDPQAIVSACDSKVYNVQHDVQKFDRFWAKSQPYSVHDILAGHPAAQKFEHGTVYQAFLDAFAYHHWHSPVSGRIVDAWVQPGTYYSEAESRGPDPAGPDWSQGYIAQVATRAIILIESDVPSIGMVAVVPIGMAEISSCVIDPKITKGAPVTKGQKLGYFQYGGSTHCLIFQPGAIAEVTAKSGKIYLQGQKIAEAQ